MANLSVKDRLEHTAGTISLGLLCCGVLTVGGTMVVTTGAKMMVEYGFKRRPVPHPPPTRI